MISLLILMAWTLALTVGSVWYLRRPYKVTEADVVAYFQKLTPDEIGDLGDKVFDARMP